MIRILQIFVFAVCLQSCKESKFISVQVIDDFWLVDSATGFNDRFRDTFYYIVNDTLILERTQSTSYPSKEDSNGVVTVLNLPELGKKVFTGWAIYKKTSDSFCLFIDSNFACHWKPFDSLSSHQSWNINFERIQSETKLVKKNVLSKNEYELTYVAADTTKLDSITIFFDYLKKNNALLSYDNVNDGKYITGGYLLSAENRNDTKRTKIIRQEIRYSERPPSDQEVRLATKLIHLYNQYPKRYNKK